MNEELKNQIKNNYERVSGAVKENGPKLIEEARQASDKTVGYLSTPQKLGPLILEQVILVFVGVLSATLIAILGHIGFVLAFVLIVATISKFINIGKQREARLVNKTIVDASVKNAVEVAYASASKKFGTDDTQVVPSTDLHTEVAQQSDVIEAVAVKQEPEEHRFPGAFAAL
jgi:hypothetical protein